MVEASYILAGSRLGSCEPHDLFIADSTHCLAFIKPLATSDVSQIVKPGF